MRGLIVGERRAGRSAPTATAPPFRSRSTRTWSTRSRPNVTARLLPKTLFGEKFVSLVPPAAPGPRRHRRGRRDRRGPQPVGAARSSGCSTTCSRCCRPSGRQDLATTLGALSQALQGRGDQLGQHARAAEHAGRGPQPGAAGPRRRTSRQLADFSENLSDAAPDLLDALADLTVDAAHDRRAARRVCAPCSRSVTGASDDLRGFLDANGDNLIGLARVQPSDAGDARPVLAGVPLPVRPARRT